MDSDLSKLFLSKMSNYKTLDGLFAGLISKYSEIKGDTINFYIDMDSIFNTLFSEHTSGYFDNGIDPKDKYALVTAILNFVGHYRNYVWNRFKFYSNFYLYHISSPSSFHTKVLPEYKEGIYSRRFFEIELTEQREYYYSNLKILDELAKVLPHIAVLDSLNIDDTLMPYFIIKKKGFENNTNIVISNRITAINNVWYFKNTYVLTAKGMNSLLSKDDESLKFMMYHGGIKSLPVGLKKNEYPWLKNYITAVLAIIGFKRFDMPNVSRLRLASALKKMDKAFAENKLVDSKMPLDMMMRQIGEAGVFGGEDVQVLLANMKILMFDKIYEKYPNVVIDRVLDGISNLNDKSTVVRINDDYLDGELKLSMIYAGE